MKFCFHERERNARIVLVSLNDVINRMCPRILLVTANEPDLHFGTCQWNIVFAENRLSMENVRRRNF